MVIVQLSDGLGNQMFQYALGRSLSLRRGDRLVLFTGRYSGLAKRQYALTAFNIAGTTATDLACLREAGLAWKVRELDIAFNAEVLAASCRNVMLVGCWQSERYFESCAETIRSDFTFREPLPREYADTIRSIADSESVCVHVRRGDYLLPDDRRGFVGCGYYQAALNVIAGVIKRPVFYVFSDDIAWCRAHLQIDHPHTFVSPPTSTHESTVSDLHLMTICKHFIIGNSTYSWWGAWLGTCDHKIVVAPQRWYRCDPEGEWDPLANQFQRSRDIIPAHWCRV